MGYDDFDIRQFKFKKNISQKYFFLMPDEKIFKKMYINTKIYYLVKKYFKSKNYDELTKLLIYPAMLFKIPDNELAEMLKVDKIKKFILDYYFDGDNLKEESYMKVHYKIKDVLNGTKKLPQYEKKLSNDIIENPSFIETIEDVPKFYLDFVDKKGKENFLRSVLSDDEIYKINLNLPLNRLFPKIDLKVNGNLEYFAEPKVIFESKFIAINLDLISATFSEDIPKVYYNMLIKEINEKYYDKLRIEIDFLRTYVTHTVIPELKEVSLYIEFVKDDNLIIGEMPYNYEDIK